MPFCRNTRTEALRGLVEEAQLFIEQWRDKRVLITNICATREVELHLGVEWEIENENVRQEGHYDPELVDTAEAR